MFRSCCLCPVLLLIGGIANLSGCTTMNTAATASMSEVTPSSVTPASGSGTGGSDTTPSPAPASPSMPPAAAWHPINSSQLQPGQVCQLVTSASADSFDASASSNGTHVRHVKPGETPMPTTLMGQVVSVDGKTIALVNVVRVPSPAEGRGSRAAPVPISGQVRIARSSLLSASLLR